MNRELVNSDNSCFDWSLNSFINMQEIGLISLNENSSQMVEIKEELDISEESKEFDRNINQTNNQNCILSFNIKTVRVKWDNMDSFMHVFENTTQIKKLEEERASRECQQIMLASLSHDMRTPLNTFTNSLQLIQMVLDELKKRFEMFPEVNHYYESLLPRLEKYF